MRLETLSIERLRLVAAARLELAPGANLFVGENAQGKTTILEAVGYLATGRSFRAARDREVIPPGSGVTSAESRFLDPSGARHLLRFALSGETKALFLDGKPLRRLADLFGVLPVVGFVPEDVALVRGGPAPRRAFLDTLAARLSRADLAAMQRYAVAIAERNALLRAHPAPPAREFDAFEDALAIAGARLCFARERAVALLAPVLARHAAALSATRDDLEMRLVHGFDTAGLPMQESEREAAFAARLREVLARNRAADRERGHAGAGPHRADLSFTLGGRDARAFASQGQARTLVLALRLAEVDAIERATGHPPILLLDDVFGELDKRRCACFFQRLSVQGTQALVTATDASAIEAELPIGARFEVRAGEVFRGR